jgi:beta-glucosidase
MSNVSAAEQPSKKRSRFSLPLAIIGYVVAIVLIASLFVGHYFANRYYDLISLYLDQKTQKVVEADGEETVHFASDFDSDADRDAYLEQVTTDISREGITLVQNGGGLPLAAGA